MLQLPKSCTYMFEQHVILKTAKTEITVVYRSQFTLYSFKLEQSVCSEMS